MLSFNLQELQNGISQDTEELACLLLQGKMKLSKKDTEDIRFERVHRIPARKKKQICETKACYGHV